MVNQQRAERLRDQTLEESFPASDPPANSGVTGAETEDKASDGHDIEAVPTGMPTSDRHATETAHHSEEAPLLPSKP